MVKFSTAAPLVPLLVTDAAVPGSPVVVRPTTTVAGPVGPVGPVGPCMNLGQQQFFLFFICSTASLMMLLFSKQFPFIGLSFIQKTPFKI
jgi:hypothetical protein